MTFRIGISVGDVVERDGDLLGDGVNIAARLEGIATPGGICISRSVFEQVANKLSVKFQDIGEQPLKNIPSPIHAYVIGPQGSANDAAVSDVRRAGIVAGIASRRGAVLAGLCGTLVVAVAAFALSPWGWLPLRSAPVAPPQSNAATSNTATPAAPLDEPLLTRFAITVPGISREARERSARDYAAAKAHKAQAVSLSPPGLWRATGRESAAVAEEAALENCQVAYGRPCTLLAIDDDLLPPPAGGEWQRRDMPRTRYAGNFDPFQIPGAAAIRQRNDIAGYAAAAGPKAVAFHPASRVVVETGAPSQREAEERALDRCNRDVARENTLVPCFLYAVGNQVVLPQRLRKPTS
jgi:adenylate cyclase